MKIFVEKRASVSAIDFCCEDMSYNVLFAKTIELVDCPPSFDLFGLTLQINEKNFIVKIKHCPFCGNKITYHTVVSPKEISEAYFEKKEKEELEREQ